MSFHIELQANLTFSPSKVYDDILNTMLNQTDKVEKLTYSSFLDEKMQRDYFQSYQTQLKKLKKE